MHVAGRGSTQRGAGCTEQVQHTHSKAQCSAAQEAHSGRSLPAAQDSAWRKRLDPGGPVKAGGAGRSSGCAAPGAAVGGGWRGVRPMARPLAPPEAPRCFAALSTVQLRALLQDEPRLQRAARLSRKVGARRGWGPPAAPFEERGWAVRTPALFGRALAGLASQPRRLGRGGSFVRVGGCSGAAAAAAGRGGAAAIAPIENLSVVKASAPAALAVEAKLRLQENGSKGGNGRGMCRGPGAAAPRLDPSPSCLF